MAKPDPALAPVTGSARLTETLEMVRPLLVAISFDCAEPKWRRERAAGALALVDDLLKPHPNCQVAREKKPIPGTIEYDEETELMQEARDALRHLSGTQPNANLSNAPKNGGQPL